MTGTWGRDHDADVVLLVLALALGACDGRAGPGTLVLPDASVVADTSIPPDAPRPDTVAEPSVPDASVDEGTAPPGPACSAPPVAPPVLGFSAPIPGPVARIAEASTMRLQLAFEGGATVAFAWQGPGLDFRVGETVRLERPCRAYGFGCWDVVRGARAVAALWSAAGVSNGNAEAPVALTGAPVLALASACVFSVEPFCRGAPMVWGNAFDLVVGGPGPTTSIATGATGAVGEWRITNIAAAAAPPSTGPSCVQDGGFTVVVSLLGPP